jgi:UDP-N-acetylmuramoyl-L-alanyl-D-glutamate--2,6-diaminopimelate ligase
MRLGALTGGQETAEVTGFVIDNRKVVVGNIFGAFQGAKVSGEDYIAAAIAAGAVAIIARPQAMVDGAIHIKSDDPRKTFVELAGHYYAPYPEICVAVTGTNGKTSTVELTRQLWRMAGLRSASIGTLGITTADEQVSTGLTTPDVATFLSNMAGLRREGVTQVAFEASSHGLDQHRVGGLKIAAGAFTNFTRDHLDYHGTMERYRAAKLRLFSDLVSEGGKAVVWADDPASGDFARAARVRGLEVFSVGTNGATLKLVERAIGNLGQNLVIEAGKKTHKVSLPLTGYYQVANALVSAGLVIATGGDVDETLANLGRLQGVRGRLERAVITKSGAPVYVDYAHTPDALQAAIAALRPHAQGKVILVFGAGGDRDTGKRTQMGAVAARDADVTIVTDDNPRSEDPALIRRSILSAAAGATEIADRREAIAHAIALAGADDIVLVAGKGHEAGQEIKGITHKFSDVDVARECAA